MNDFKSYTSSFHELIISFSTCWDLTTIERKGLIQLEIIEGLMLGLAHSNELESMNFGTLEKVFRERLDNPHTKKMIIDNVQTFERNKVIYNKENWKSRYRNELFVLNKIAYWEDSMFVQFEEYLLKFPDNTYKYGDILYSYEYDYMESVAKYAKTISLDLSILKLDSLKLNEIILKTEKANIVYFKVENDPNNALIEEMLKSDNNKIEIYLNFDFLTLGGFDFNSFPKNLTEKFFNVLRFNIHEEGMSKLIIFDDDLNWIWSSVYHSSMKFKFGAELYRISKGN
jgi:hypothetical protein